MANIIRHPEIAKRIMGLADHKTRNEAQMVNSIWFFADKKVPIYQTVHADNMKQLQMALALGDTLLSLAIHFPLKEIPTFARNRNLKELLFIYPVYAELRDDNKLPESLTRLSLRTDRQVPVGYLPSGLQYLSLGDNFFNHPILPGSLPNGIVRLEFGKRFNRLIAGGILPSSLKMLVFGEKYSTEFEHDSLPEGLETLILDCEYGGRTLDPQVLPGSLKNVIYRCSDEDYYLDEGEELVSLCHLVYGLLKNPVNRTGNKINVEYDYDHIVGPEELIEQYEYSHGLNQ